MIDLCSQEAKPLLSIKEALAHLESAIKTVVEVESVELKNALGRVLSVAINSPINIPFDRNAAMDGYAYASADIDHNKPCELTVIGTSWAGRPYHGQMQAGQCVRIFTGAVVPEQADSVIMQEQVQVNGKQIQFPANAPIHQNVRAIGEDIEQGQCLLPSAKKLTACDLGLLASAGINQITVTRQLKIACFSTGDELIALGQSLESGKIYDSNRYMLAALLTDPCYRLIDLGALPDDPEQITNHLRHAAKNVDVIITTGGVSVGDADYIKEALANCGNINFWKIAIKPGKPLAFGSIEKCYFFGLPGNSIAVITTFQQIVTPALKQLCGETASRPLRLEATLTNTVKKSPGREEFQRGILTQDNNGHFQVASLSKQGSHVLSSMSQANCYIVLPNLCNGMQSGDTVTVEPFQTFLKL